MNEFIWFLVAILHIICMIVLSLYTVIIRKPSKLDLYFLLLFALVNIHWLLYKGECFISYYYKDENENENNINTNNEMTNILGKELYLVLIAFFVIMYCINTYVVGTRQGINKYLLLASIFMFTTCIILLRFEHIYYYYYGVPNFIINFIIFLTVVYKLL
jgi:hypothetical protein